MWHRIIAACVGLLLLGGVSACQQPSDSASPGPEQPGGATPIAPAIEPEPSGPETPIGTLPSGEPVAPAIEPEPTGPEPTIEFDPG